MVFSSVPFYQDPPNWQQPQQHPNDHETLNPHSLQLPPQLGISGGATALSNKPTSERARLAKIPVPDGPLRCPRPGCESTNTKFCYFNNYNLSQPRHFCKACRRYWTRGGALRNVPVGGACRRNKRRKKSPAAVANGPKPGSPPQADQRLLQQPVGGAAAAVSFMASLQNMTSLGMGVTSQHDSSQIGYMAAAQPNQQLSFLAGLTGANSYMYPYGGVMETASFGKGMMVSPRGGGGGGGGGQLRENVGQFWSAHMNNGGTAAAAGSSLYMDGSFRG